MSSVLPAAIVFVNNDLTDNVKAKLERQLFIDESITGTQFDSRVAADSDYPDKVRQLNTRLMVIRPYTELTNRTLADVVIWVSHGLASIEQNKYGPHGVTYQVNHLYWGQLCVWNVPLYNSERGTCCR